MRISVVIPCRDAEATLAQTIRSALAQTLPPAEVLVVDDRSADASAQIAGAFGRTVKVLVPRGEGANRARLAGAEASRGEALVFLDADDLLAPNVLEELARALDREPDGVAGCAWRRLVWEDGVWRARPPSCARRGWLQDPLSAWLSGWFHPPCATLWSRAAYERSGGWDPDLRINQDGELMVRALAEGAPLTLTDRAIAYYRRAPLGRRSLSGGPPDRARVEARLAALRTVKAALDRRGRLKSYGGSLARAFRTAAESAARFPDVARACRQEARALGGPVWAQNLSALAAAADVAAGRLARGLNRALAAAPPATQPRPRAAGKPWPLPAAAPGVSVIIPTFNRARTLPRALESVLAQTYRDFELLVVDDASTDQTEALVRARADSRIRYLRQETNRGVAAARNRGLAQARAPLIAFLDSDDLWAPQKLARQVALFARSPLRVGLVYTGVETMDEHGLRSIDLPRLRGDAFPALLRGNAIHGGGSNVMIRREAYEVVGGFDETLPAIEDYEYWLRIARFFYVDYAPEPLARVHDARSTDEARALARRSLRFAENQIARRRLHALYQHDMRAAGAEHAFLMSSIRRQANDPQGEIRAIRALALRAAAARPLDPQAYAWLALSVAPQPLRAVLRRAAAAGRRRISARPQASASALTRV